jgi:hypothetical protein
MKFFLTILIYSFILISFAKADIKDCSEFSKLSKEYLECTKNNLKQKSDDTGLTNKLKNFKSSKTLTEFFKKNKGEE